MFVYVQGPMLLQLITRFASAYCAIIEGTARDIETTELWVKWSFITRLSWFREPITNQSNCFIGGPVFFKYWTGHCPEWSRTITLEEFLVWFSQRTCSYIKDSFSFSSNYPSLLFCLTSDMSTPLTGSKSELGGWSLLCFFFQFVSVTLFSLRLTKLALNCSERISVLGVFCSDSLRSVRTVKTSGRYSPSAALAHGK